MGPIRPAWTRVSFCAWTCQSVSGPRRRKIKSRCLSRLDGTKSSKKPWCNYGLISVKRCRLLPLPYVSLTRRGHSSRVCIPALKVQNALNELVCTMSMLALRGEVKSLPLSSLSSNWIFVHILIDFTTKADLVLFNIGRNYSFLQLHGSKCDIFYCVACQS